MVRQCQSVWIQGSRAVNCLSHASEKRKRKESCKNDYDASTNEIEKTEEKGEVTDTVRARVTRRITRKSR